MKLAGSILALIAACCLGGCASIPKTHGAVCLVTHYEVILVPIMCKKNGEVTMCNKPVVADVCDHIEIDSP